MEIVDGLSCSEAKQTPVLLGDGGRGLIFIRLFVVIIVLGPLWVACALPLAI